MTEILRPRRSLSLAAIVLFVAVYAAILMLVLAPRDSFSTAPGNMIETGD